MQWLTCDEVKEIRDAIAGIIDGSIKQNKRLCFIEQDINFEFIFDNGKFSYAELSLGYWETEGRGCLTGNRLVLCLGMEELEQMLFNLRTKTSVKGE